MQRLTMNEPRIQKKIALPEVPEVPELKLELDKSEDALVSEKISTDDSIENIQSIDNNESQIENQEVIADEPVFSTSPNIDELSKTLEALLFVSKDPLRPEKIKEILGLTSIIPIRQAAQRLQKFYDETGRAYELREIAEGYLLQTKTNFDDYIQKLRKARRELKITQNALTTLSIVAYKQPITRSEIDTIRGVNSSHHMKNLLDNALVKVVGKKEAPGSPRLYGTTKRFLEVFGLKSLTGLPKSTEAFEEKVRRNVKQVNESEQTPEIETTQSIETVNPEHDELREISGKKREIIDPDEFK